MKLKTFIKYIGNKSKHLKYILPHIPKEYNTYMEPFIGSGALFLKLQPEKWIINDINKDLINVWNLVKNEPESIIEIFKEFGKIFKPLNIKDKLKYCRILLEYFKNMDFDIERAILYMILKYSAYMGEIIKNNKFHISSLDFNIYLNNKYSFLKQSYYDNLLNTNYFLNETKGKIMNTDYKNILKHSKKGDFVFLDPPYVDDYTHLYNINQKLDIYFIKDLLDEIKKLDSKGVKWLMTQSDTKEIRKIFKDYVIIEYPVYRRYQNKYANELLIKNF